MSEQVHAVASLLHRLLTRHDCFASVAIVPSVFRDHHQPICDALRKSLSLQKLKLYALRMATQLPRNIRLSTASSEAPSESWNCKNLAALTNETLEELTLDLLKFSTNEWRCLFRALASNPRLKKVTIPTFKQADVAEICRAARETGVPERFIIGTHYVLENTVDALTECKELSSVAVQGVMLYGYALRAVT
ncbi:hypothetical protein MTO96_039813 [Rhipicephalus appendiculatus]